MTKPLIRNIYYMLAYAFSVLREQGFREMATESFENTGELFAAILARGIQLLVRRGVGRDYLNRQEALDHPRGKIELTDSLKTLSLKRKRLVCVYDEFSVDTPMNRVIKSTSLLLLQSRITSERKRELRNLLRYFAEVKKVDLRHLDWRFTYHKNNRLYRMLISICYLVVHGLLETNSDGTARLMDYLDEWSMSRLYEKFLLEYYKKEFAALSVSSPRIPWGIDGVGADDPFLPSMMTDVTLSTPERTLIIDAKYYSKTIQNRYGNPKLFSGNLYQIFTYVKNMDFERNRARSVGEGDRHEVAGLLLYAMTDEPVHPNSDYDLFGNRISAKTLDLNREFPEIAEHLDNIATGFFGVEKG